MTPGLLDALLGPKVTAFTEAPSPPSPTSPQIGDNRREGENNRQNPSTETLIPRPNEAARVTPSPIQALAGERTRRFLVALDGSTACPRCGEKGYIPHHLSLIFWIYWSRERMEALADAMRPDERLAWLGHQLVRLEDVAGKIRLLRNTDNEWIEDNSGTGLKKTLK
jgi:hypothetical protein